LNARVTLLTSSIEFISVFSNPTSSLAFRVLYECYDASVARHSG
jgi:hypothetical protein